MANIQHERISGDRRHPNAQLGGDPSRLLPYSTPDEWGDQQRINGMDNVGDIPNVHGSQSNGNAVRSGAQSTHYVVQPEDVRVLANLSLEKIQRIVMNYNRLSVPKEPTLVFLQHLTARQDAWFVEIGEVGLVYLTNMILERDADLNVLFWDGKLRKDRKAAVRQVIAGAFKEFDLPRISAILPSTNPALQRLLGDVGLTVEGTIRKGWQVNPVVDAVYLGILKEEATWPVIPLNTSV